MKIGFCKIQSKVTLCKMCFTGSLYAHAFSKIFRIPALDSTTNNKLLGWGSSLCCSLPAFVVCLLGLQGCSCPWTLNSLEFQVEIFVGIFLILMPKPIIYQKSHMIFVLRWWVLRLRCLLFLISNPFETWLLPSGKT